MALSSYTQHEPIDIRNDTALASYAVSGTGDPGTPYIIEGWNITTENSRGIYIGFTTKYFIVRDCWIGGATAEVYRGILIDAVATGTAVIERVHCESWYVGLEVSSSPEALVKGCSIRDCQVGLMIGSSNNSTVFNNTVFENNGWGLRISSSSTTVANNTLWSNTHGLEIYYANDVILENNTLSDDGFSFLFDTIAGYETINEKNNVVNGLPLSLLINEVGTNYDGGIGQAVLINCTGVKLANQNLSYCETGAYLRWCTDCQIRDSQLNHNDNSGLYGYYSNNINIEKVTTSFNSQCGVQLTHCTGDANDCDIVENDRGVELVGSWGAISIQNNRFVNNTDYGLLINAGWNASVANNNFTDDGIYCQIFTLQDYVRCSDNVTGNLVNGKPLVFYNSLQDVTISSPHGQIFLVNCSNVMIASLDCSFTVTGITIAFSNGCSVVNSDCSFAKQVGVNILYSNFTLVQNVNCDHSTGAGIRTANDEDTTLLDNHCSDGAIGIVVLFSQSGLVKGNILTGNNYIGLQLFSSEDVRADSNICNLNQLFGIYAEMIIGLTLVNNTCISNDGDGISITGCIDLFVEGNDCEMNSQSGLLLDSSWDGIIISNRIVGNELHGLYIFGVVDIEVNWNTILANGLCGIRISGSNSRLIHNIIALNNDYGVYFSFCTNVSVRHNFFVNNNGGGIQAYDSVSSANLWYDPIAAEGNYWSDWEGFGSYYLDGNAGVRDIYPLGDVDSDFDTLPDSWEIANGLNPYSPDSDADSLPDAWEVTHGLNPLANDAAEDLDDDGLSNLEEYILGLNPASNDSDGDLMPDLWEVQNYLNPLFNDAALDPDSDDISNLDEYYGGTNPQVYNGPSITTTATTTVTSEIPDYTILILIAAIGGFSLAIVLVVFFQMLTRRRNVSE